MDGSRIESRCRAAAAIGSVLVGLTFLTYEDVRHHEFLRYDDDRYIVDNPLMRSGLDARGIRAFFRPYHDNWIPLTWLSLRADYAIHGPRPAAFLATNVLLHSGAALALFLALLQASRDWAVAAFCAAVFAVHPLHVESVAWATERKDVLSGLFFLLAILAYTRYAKRPFAWGGFGLVTVLFGLSLLAKPMAVTLPFALLLLDGFPLDRLQDPLERRRALFEKLPWIAMSFAVAGVTWWVQRASGAMHFGDQLSLFARVANALESVLVYIAQSFWPVSLSVFYPHSTDSQPLRVAVCAAVVAGLTWGALRSARVAPQLAVGWLWFLGMLVPVIGIVQVGMQAHADRYTYLPQIGLCIALAFSGRALVSRYPSARLPVAGLALACVGALAFTAHAQVAVWRDTESLFSHARQVTGDNAVAEHQLGSIRLRQGRLAEARFHFARARDFAPSWSPAEIGLGEVLTRSGAHARAIAHYRRALELDPSRADVAVKLGLVLLALERHLEAETELRRALAHIPTSSAKDRATAAAAHFGLGQAARAAGRRDDSIREYRQGLELAPSQAQGHLGLARSLIEADQLGEASDAIDAARQLGADTARLEAELSLRTGAGDGLHSAP